MKNSILSVCVVLLVGFSGYLLNSSPDTQATTYPTAVYQRATAFIHDGCMWLIGEVEYIDVVDDTILEIKYPIGNYTNYKRNSTLYFDNEFDARIALNSIKSIWYDYDGSMAIVDFDVNRSILNMADSVLIKLNCIEQFGTVLVSGSNLRTYKLSASKPFAYNYQVDDYPQMVYSYPNSWKWYTNTSSYEFFNTADSAASYLNDLYCP